MDVLPTLVDKADDVALVHVKTWLSTHPKRNALAADIISCALWDGRKVLALADRTEQLDILTDMFPGVAGKIHGGVSKKERRAALHGYDLVFATTQLAKEGLDKPELDTVVILLPLTSEGAFRQILGRIQRIHADKKTPMIYVLEDEKIGICVGMCKKLRRHLAAFGYTFETVKEANWK
jgi:superfamily II DNA or RNA helicase